MPDTVVILVEQLAIWYWKPAALDFTFLLGVVVRDITNNPYNEVNNDIRAPIVDRMDAQDV